MYIVAPELRVKVLLVMRKLQSITLIFGHYCEPSLQEQTMANMPHKFYFTITDLLIYLACFL